MDILAKLFGGQSRVKIMRLFLLHSEQAFTLDDITSRSRVPKASVRKELNALAGLGMIKPRTITVDGYRGSKKKVSAWILETGFVYLNQLKDLLIDPNLLLDNSLKDRFKPIGKIKLMLASGVFIGDDKSRADLLIVGDKIKKNILNQVVKGLEAEIGKELDYVVFDTQEFMYRLEMYDKLVCDILDFPHEKLIDVGQLSQLSTYAPKN